ncbi:MAG: hypothetical protein WC734_06140 [Patescibacteria group bacterium]|jgi:hypothetical protein
MELGLDFSNVKPGIANAMIILAIVIIMVPLAKFIFIQKVYIPGVSELVSAI